MEVIGFGGTAVKSEASNIGKLCCPSRILLTSNRVLLKSNPRIGDKTLQLSVSTL